MGPRSLLAMIALAGVLAAPEASALVLESFQTPFPANMCLPNSGAPVVFSGAYCDGSVCPPDPVSTCGTGYFADQTAAPGVWQGAPRRAEVGSGLGTRANAQILPGIGQLEVHHLEGGGSGSAHSLVLKYGDASAPLDLDLQALGFTGVRMPITCESNPFYPLHVIVRLRGDLLDPGGPVARAAAYVTESRLLTLPLEAFVISNGFSFSDVHQIQINFIDGCLSIGCEPMVIPTRNYSIGSISIDSGATATSPRSWGGLKVRYR
ncbi:MAG: hypothetical protein HOP12_08365 [Candidatus Eisenbacteria bacterium]|uniref:Uncharacterized protein n=1 Tax=Eiseniibacteriota bacterium TaxID=2212470 RepID=A0A849SHW7_UNCEI|nr:hypothetical protein [Candidatus Eisenbacteria bacterium]